MPEYEKPSEDNPSKAKNSEQVEGNRHIVTYLSCQFEMKWIAEALKFHNLNVIDFLGNL